jgi:putative membrane protein
MNSRRWFRSAFQIKGSVVIDVLPRTIVCALFALLITVLQNSGYQLEVPFLGSLIPSIVLSLLLVFRTNTAYERFWEGRKAWGNLINTTRNLARLMLVAISEDYYSDRQEKITAMRLLPAFAIAVKQHLRNAPLADDPVIEDILTPNQLDKLQTVGVPPLLIAVWINQYLQSAYVKGQVDRYQLTQMNRFISDMVDSLGICERIQRTPMPLAYAIHLKQLLLIYCLSLPFQMVARMGWYTAPLTGLISFTLLGIEEIGLQIEDPFGLDPNDLPLDNLCRVMALNIDDIVRLTDTKQYAN